MQFDPRINNRPQFTQMGGGMKPDPYTFSPPTKDGGVPGGIVPPGFPGAFPGGPPMAPGPMGGGMGQPPPGFAFSPIGAPGGPQMAPGPQEAGALPELRPAIRPQMQAKPVAPQKPSFQQPMDGEIQRRRQYGRALMGRRQTPKLPPGQSAPILTGAPTPPAPTY